MKTDAFDGIRKDFEKHIGVAYDNGKGLTRNESGAYTCLSMELAYRAFLAGYLLAVEQLFEGVEREAHPSPEPTFTVTPDARELAQAYQSVNPDYPSPATYLEAE